MGIRSPLGGDGKKVEKKIGQSIDKPKRHCIFDLSITRKKNAVQDTIISFLKNAPNYKQVHTFQTIADALGCVNLSSGDSGWYTPKAIKIEGVDGIFCLRQSGCINPEFKIKQTSAGFEVLEMTPESYRDLEKIASI